MTIATRAGELPPGWIPEQEVSQIGSAQTIAQASCKHRGKLAWMLGGGESGGQVLGSGLSGFPVGGEEFFEAAHGVGADALKDVAQIGERIDLESFAGGL